MLMCLSSTLKYPRQRRLGRAKNFGMKMMFIIQVNSLSTRHLTIYNFAEILMFKILAELSDKYTEDLVSPHWIWFFLVMKLESWRLITVNFLQWSFINIPSEINNATSTFGIRQNHTGGTLNVLASGAATLLVVGPLDTDPNIQVPPSDYLILWNIQKAGVTG